MTTNKTPVMTGEVMTGKALSAQTNSYRQSTTTPRQMQAPSKNQRLAWACRYALQGLAVFPCNGKLPLTEHGYKDASTDLETIGAWWQRWPAANIGLPMAPNGLVAIDVDPRNGGTLAALSLPAELRTWRAATGGGGLHLVFAAPDRDDLPGILGPGIDLKFHGYVIVSPSIHPDTRKEYRWILGQSPWDLDPAPVPAELLGRMTRQDAPPAADVGQCDHKHAQTRTEPGTIALELVEDALRSIDPWAGGYHWWLKILMAIHSEYPGQDGQKVAVAWACGKPGEVERLFEKYLKSDGNRSGRVGIGTLFFEAKLAGWVRPAAEPAGLPWTITKDDWDSCPVCRASYTALLDDGSLVNRRDFCRNPKCRVQRKRKMGKALRPLLDYTGIRAETVPGMVWRQWRENANRSGRRYTRIPLASGDSLCLVETDAPTVNLPGVLDAAVEAFKAKPPKRNMSHERQVKLPAAVDALPPPPRPKIVERWIVSQPEQRRALLDVLNRLGVAYERRAYGGWRTAPLDTETRDVLHLELLTVPGLVSLAPTTSISLSSTTAKMDAQWPDDLPHNEAEVPGYAVRERVNVGATTPLKRSKRLSRAKRANDGRKRAALNAIDRQSALRQLEARRVTETR